MLARVGWTDSADHISQARLPIVPNAGTTCQLTKFIGRKIECLSLLSRPFDILAKTLSLFET